MSDSTAQLIALAIVALFVLGMLKGCQEYDMNLKCIEATGAKCVEVTKDL